MDHIKLGKYGEDAACSYIAGQGMELLERNYRASGEIDIIALDGETIVFIEVKTRRNTRYGRAAEAVNKQKAEKIMTTALEYIAQHNLHRSNMRFDVAEVYVQGDNMEISYIKSAFEG